MGVLRRYKSTIYGNYRLAALRYGAIVGGLMMLYVVICALAGTPIRTPESYGTDAVLLLGIGYFVRRYAKQMPDGKVSLKELLMLGIDMGIVASLLYGLLLWVLMQSFFTSWVDLFVQSRLSVMEEAAAEAIAKVKCYNAGNWAFIGGFRSFVMSILFAFFAALLFSTERGAIVNKKQK